MAKSIVRLGNEDHVNTNYCYTRKIFAEYLTESNCLFVKYPV